MNLIKTGFQRYNQHLLWTAQAGLVLLAFCVPITVTATDILIVASSLLCVLSGKFFKEFKVVITNPITISILLLMLVVFAGMFWSIAAWPERLVAFHKYQKLLYFLFLLPLAMDARWRERAITAFLLAIVITVLISYGEAYVGLNFIRANNPSYVFHNHNETSYFVAIATYILVDRALYGQRYRWLYWLLAAIFTFQEFFINTGRTGWIVYFALIILFYIQRASPGIYSPELQNFKNHLIKLVQNILLAIITILILLLVVYSFSKPFKSDVSVTINSFSSAYTKAQIAQQNNTQVSNPDIRLVFFTYSLKLANQHPIMGLGTAGFQAAYKKFPIPAWGPGLDTPHNEYLLLIVQTGLLGLGLFLYFFYTQWYVSFHIGPEWRCAQALVLSFMVACFFNAFLYTTISGHFYVVFLSLLFAQFRGEKPRILNRITP